nr:hypothetical protein [Armatimonas sp.]
MSINYSDLEHENNGRYYYNNKPFSGMVSDSPIENLDFYYDVEDEKVKYRTIRLENGSFFGEECRFSSEGTVLYYINHYGVNLHGLYCILSGLEIINISFYNMGYIEWQINFQEKKKEIFSQDQKIVKNHNYIFYNHMFSDIRSVFINKYTFINDEDVFVYSIIGLGEGGIILRKLFVENRNLSIVDNLIDVSKFILVLKNRDLYKIDEYIMDFFRE